MKTFEINGVTKTLHEWHMELWNWLADNPEKIKQSWFNFIKCKYGDYPDDKCFACEYDVITSDSACSNCPICKREEGKSCLNGLYHKWYDETDLQKRYEYALQIANLEWNEQEESDVQ